MNTLLPLKNLLDTQDFDGAKTYLDCLKEIEGIGQWYPFSGMIGRIQIMKAALYRDVHVEPTLFRLAATDAQLRNQILFSYRMEAKKRLQDCPAAERAHAIDRAGDLLITLSKLMTEALPEAIQASAQREVIVTTFKSNVFPREIALKADVLAPYRDLLLELDLGL